MNSSLRMRGALIGVVVVLVGLGGCRKPGDDAATEKPAQNAVGGAKETGQPDGGRAAVAAPAGTAQAEDVAAARKLLDQLGGNARYAISSDGVLTEVVIEDGSPLTPDDIALLGRLGDLETLQIFDIRMLTDEIAAQLAGLKNLKSLALTNSVISDPTVELIVQSFPDLVQLDLSSNATMTNGALKIICQLPKLERLTLVQNRFNDLGTINLEKIPTLETLDLRGNMEAGDLTMEVVGLLPNLVALKHRSTTVSDFGIECLAESKSLQSLLMQDFNITSQAGPALARLEKLNDLEIFRCQGFGSEGVLALKGMPLTRLRLRDLPAVDDQAMAVFEDLPALKRLELWEIASISDEGLKGLGNLQTLEWLDVWTVPQLGDATVEVISKLPNLKVLSLRTTGVTDAAVDHLLAMPKLERLTFKDNAGVTPQGLEKLAAKKWVRLDTGQ